MMSQSLAELRDELIEEVMQQLQMGTYNTFGDIVEVSCGREKANEFRKLAIQEGKWIRMDGRIYNRET